MKKKLRGITVLLFTCVLLAGVLSACTSKNDETVDKKQPANTEASDKAEKAEVTKAPEATKAPVETEKVPELKGTLSMAGSTSMEKLANIVSEAFMLKYPEVLVSPEFIGSSAGVEALLAGTADIGNASRNLKDTEISSGAVENIVAIDGIAVILDTANIVADLTKDQLVKIYKGEIINWIEIGGADQPIVVVGRESGSGTRGAFEELLEIEELCKYSNEINSTGGVMAKVASTPGAIGYVSLDVMDGSVIGVKLEGVEPTADNIVAGDYFLSRPFVMATIGEVSEQNEIVKTFLEYLQSEEGKGLIESVGLITVN